MKKKPKKPVESLRNYKLNIYINKMRFTTLELPLTFTFLFIIGFWLTW